MAKVQNKMRNILLLCFLLLAGLLVAISVSAVWSNSQLFGLTEQIHRQPLTISNKVLLIHAHIVSMHRYIRDLALAQNREDSQKAIGHIQGLRDKVNECFQVVLSRLSGDKQIILDAEKAFAEWWTIRQKISDYILKGEKEKASRLSLEKEGAYISALHTHMENLIDFAYSKANSFYQGSQLVHQKGRTILMSLTFLFILLAGVVFVLLYRFIIRYEIALSRSEVRFRDLVETTADWIWEIDADANFLYVSPGVEKLLGYRPEELMGKNAFDLMTERESEKVRKEYFEFVRKGKSFEHLININRHKDGREVVIESSGRPFFDCRGKLLGYRGIDRDITARENMVSDLQKANATKTQFLAHMSHEIRTPLNSILGMIELLQEDNLTPEQKDILEISDRSGKILLNLISDVLDMSKIEAGQLELERRSFDLPLLVNGVIKVLNNQLVEKRLNLKVNIEDNVSQYVFGDNKRLEQVLLNVIGNSVKFTDHGEINIWVHCSDCGETVFEVKDTGIGIPKEKHDLIFSPFSQADSSTTRKYGGTGLGLSICKQLVEAMGGKISLQSEIGVGTSISISIPLEEASSIISKRVALEEVRPKHFRRLSILLADDSKENQAIMQLFLKNQEGYRLTIVDNGAEAVEMVKKNHFDIILMDIQMPIMDGLTAVPLIRKWQEENKTPRSVIIALTAHAIRESHEEFLSLGFDNTLFKPISKVHLLKFLEEI